MNHLLAAQATIKADPNEAMYARRQRSSRSIEPASAARLPAPLNASRFTIGSAKLLVMQLGAQILIDDGEAEANWAGDLPLGPLARRGCQGISHRVETGRVIGGQGERVDIVSQVAPVEFLERV
jgi:hypothetical protein